MYESHFGLQARPFLTVPDPGFLYWAKGHQLAFSMLRFGLMTLAPVTVVTGEIGAGKTTLLRHMIASMPGDREIGLVANFQPGRGSLLEWILMSLGQPYDGLGPVRLFQGFQDHVIARFAAGKRIVLVFDEAQNLDVPTLEELRMLSNINADGHQLLQLVLVGQPQLRDRLADPALTQFCQRIASDFHLAALGPDEVEPYIDARLRIAGARRKIFTPRVCLLIHEATGGVPRLINTLCDLCLVYGFSEGAEVIGEAILREFLESSGRHGIYRQFHPLQTPAESGPDLIAVPAAAVPEPEDAPVAVPPMPGREEAPLHLGAQAMLLDPGTGTGSPAGLPAAPGPALAETAAARPASRVAAGLFARMRRAAF